MAEYRHIVVHYDEIALKAQNRAWFEKLLAQNIMDRLGTDFGRCRRESGQLVIDAAEGRDVRAGCETVACVPGVAHVAAACSVDVDLALLGRTAVSLVAELPFQTFKVAAHRRVKTHDFKSVDVNRAVGADILAAYPDRNVRLADPDLTVKIEVSVKHAYLSVERIEGVGGLPSNPRQKVVGLLSGGLDSPVAMQLMMKRGCEVILVHFQNEYQMTCGVEDKIQRLAEQLSRYQARTLLVTVPFGEVQREIIKHVRAALRMVFYRRVMLRMAASIARRARARFLVTGDSLSQVASQTYDNLAATYASAELPVLSPLIGLNKREIVDIARRIGTFDISSIPYDDCCSFFVAKHPELRARAEELAGEESRMALDSVIAAALDGAVHQQIG